MTILVTTMDMFQMDKIQDNTKLCNMHKFCIYQAGD